MVLTVVCTAMCFSVSAASAIVSINPNKDTYAIGETFTISGTFNSDVAMYAFTGTLSYDPSKVQFVSGGTDKGTYVNFADGLSGEKKVTYSATFKTIAEGRSYFKFSGEGSDSVNNSTAQGGHTITIATPATSSSVPSTSSESTSSTLSNNANLKSLSIEGATLSPAFSRNTTGYTVTVANSVEKIKIKASAADSGATVEGAGTYSLDVGTNKLTIKVTAADGTKKEYAISVKRNTADEDAAEQAPPTEGEKNPLEVTVGGKTYTVMTDISAVTVPAGFTPSTAVYNGVEVGCLTEATATYTLYGLYDTVAGKSALFSLSDGEFEHLLYLEVAGKTYIFTDAEKGLEAPDGYYETTLPLEMGNAKAYGYTNSRWADFYIVHCWCEGKEGFYRYDQRDNTIQRAPEFSLIKAVSATPENEKKNFAEWFTALTPTAKLIFILAICAVIALVVFIVFLVLMIKNRVSAPLVPMLSDDDGELPIGDGFVFSGEDTAPEQEMPVQSEEIPEREEIGEEVEEVSEDEE